MLLLLILLRQTGALEMCSLGHWWCQSSNQTGEPPGPVHEASADVNIFRRVHLRVSEVQRPVRELG